LRSPAACRKPATGPGPFAATVYGALAGSKPFRAESAGFAGTSSDGLSQLDASHALAAAELAAGVVRHRRRRDAKPLLAVRERAEGG
jgi:hypothetical protein